MILFSRKTIASNNRQECKERFIACILF